MERNDDQVCIITVLFTCNDDVFAIGVKAKIEELLKDIPGSRVDIRIGSPTAGASTHRA